MKRTLRRRIFDNIYAVLWTAYHIIRYGLAEADRIAQKKLRQEKARLTALQATKQERMQRKYILN